MFTAFSDRLSRATRCFLASWSLTLLATAAWAQGGVTVTQAFRDYAADLHEKVILSGRGNAG
jgi:hypothetical protein